MLGLDFTGDVLVEARSPGGIAVGELRADLASVGLPGAVVQFSDAGRTVLVPVQSDSPAAVAAIRKALGPGAETFGEETVGPKVSGELLRSGCSRASARWRRSAIWLRFEAKFGGAALLTTLHDAVLMIGLYAVTGLTFDLTSIAALLLVAGCSINDTGIVLDRIRKRLARHRAAPGCCPLATLPTNVGQPIVGAVPEASRAHASPLTGRRHGAFARVESGRRIRWPTQPPLASPPVAPREDPGHDRDQL